MSEKTISRIERRIGRIKQDLQKIGPMRPGSLTRQYKNPKEKSGPYWQISYTRNMRSKSDYVRADCVPDIRRQIAAYKRFKRLMDEWIDLSIELSKLKMQLDKKRGSK
jgi:hypothetical protein